MPTPSRGGFGFLGRRVGGSTIDEMVMGGGWLGMSRVITGGGGRSDLGSWAVACSMCDRMTSNV